MKKIILIAIVALTVCNTRISHDYVNIVQTIHTEQNYSIYYVTNLLGILNIEIYDTIGKFHIGDTLKIVKK